MGGVIGLGDLHLPWADKRAIAGAVAYIRHRKPAYVVQLGDYADFYSATRFARSLNIMTPEMEHKRARAQGEELWSRIKDAAGTKCERIMLLGNHDDRPLKRCLEIIPEQEHLVREGLRNFWTFDGVKTIPSEETLIIDGVLYTHGHLRFGMHIKKFRMPVVTGHLHKGDVTFERVSVPTGNRLTHRTIFEANAGYLGDPYALPMRYRPKRDLYAYTRGLFELDDYGPRFIDLEAS